MWKENNSTCCSLTDNTNSYYSGRSVSLQDNHSNSKDVTPVFVLFWTVILLAFLISQVPFKVVEINKILEGEKHVDVSTVSDFSHTEW